MESKKYDTVSVGSASTPSPVSTDSAQSTYAFDNVNEHPDPLPEIDTLADGVNNNSYYLRNGELWVVDYISKTERMLTTTDSKIDTFFLSPSRKYAACLRRVDLVGSPGLYEEGDTISMVPVHNVLVLNLLNKQIVRQFAQPEDVFVYVGAWVSKSRFVFWCSDGFAINSTYVYDAYRDSIQEVRYSYPDR